MNQSREQQIQSIADVQQKESSIKTDKMFASLLIFQWALAIGLALWLSPKSWDGTLSSVHIHLKMALVLGGLITALPVYASYFWRGSSLNRYVIATAQMIYSILFIHITGGRIETHFHVFGSLAFLAFYMDWKVILWATILTAADHFVRGWFLPESIYGVLSASALRAIEHSAWVLFEDFFLLISIATNRQQAFKMAEHQLQLEESVTNIELIVASRTADLIQSQALVSKQQEMMVNSAKLSALGEMAAGVAHEINTPLGVLYLNNEILLNETSQPIPRMEVLEKAVQTHQKTTTRIAKIVQGLRNFARDGRHDKMGESPVEEIIADTMQLCYERFKNHDVELRVGNVPKDAAIACRPAEVSQVLLNLLNNSYDAIDELAEKWVQIEVSVDEAGVCLSVTDSGSGISKALQEKMFQPFFSTKEIGKGTGLGLSISMGIMSAHGGVLSYDSGSARTRFVMSFPRVARIQDLISA